MEGASFDAGSNNFDLARSSFDMYFSSQVKKENTDKNTLIINAKIKALNRAPTIRLTRFKAVNSTTFVNPTARKCIPITIATKITRNAIAPVYLKLHH